MISYFFQLQTMLYKWRFKFLLTISKWFPSVSIFNHCWGTFWCIWKKTVDAFPTDWLSPWKFYPYSQLCNNWCSASWILLLEPNQCFIWWICSLLSWSKKSILHKINQNFDPRWFENKNFSWKPQKSSTHST